MTRTRTLVVFTTLAFGLTAACSVEVPSQPDDGETPAPPRPTYDGLQEPTPGGLVGRDDNWAPTPYPPRETEEGVDVPLDVPSLFASERREEADGMGGGGNLPLTIGTGDLTVLVLFDMSGSMTESWEDAPRWLSASNAFMDGITEYQEKVTLGAIIFPRDGNCGVPPLWDPAQIAFQAGISFKNDWATRIDQGYPDGGTPLGAAFEQADVVVRESARIGLIGEGRRFRVAVVTDGEPNCGTDPNRLVYLASTWRALGVEVHIMGLPGSIAAQKLLDRLADTGGTGEYVAPDNTDQAEETFNILVK